MVLFSVEGIADWPIHPRTSAESVETENRGAGHPALVPFVTK